MPKRHISSAKFKRLEDDANMPRIVRMPPDTQAPAPKFYGHAAMIGNVVRDLARFLPSRPVPPIICQSSTMILESNAR